MVGCQGLPIQNWPGASTGATAELDLREGAQIPSRTTCLCCPLFYPDLGWLQRRPHVPCALLGCARGGPTHTDRDLRVSRRVQPSEQNSCLPKACPPLPHQPADREQGGGGGHVYPPAFLGQVEGPSWSLLGHTHPETSPEWALFSPSLPRGQRRSCS